MLRLIAGTDRVSLTTHAYHHIKNSVRESETEWILIVPEQFSFEAELRLCREGGATISQFAEVLSFTRLSDRVAAKQGGVAGEYLDKGGQLLTMALAAEQVASRIKLYAAVLRKPEFLSDTIRMINEFGSYCLEPEDLFLASKRAEGQFAQKLEELGLLYEAYRAVCANGKADPTDKLMRMLDRLPECEWIENKCFYIDGFSDFTEVEQRIIEQLIICAADVYVSLPTGPKGSVIDRFVEKECRVLQRIAQRNMVECSMHSVDEAAPRREAIQKLQYLLFTYGGGELDVLDDEIRLTVCPSPSEECRIAVQAVSELLCAGARCRDISIACTDLKCYEIPLKEAFSAAGISAYFAGERSLLSKPIVTAVLNSLYAATGVMDHEDVVLYLKSGLPNASQEKCDRLDNYAYLWNIKGQRWGMDWTFHPRGFGERMTPEDDAYLADLNEDRRTIMRPLLSLRERLTRAVNTGQMVLALYNFTEDVHLREKLQKKAEAYAAEGNGQAAQELSQIYELLIQSLEQTWFVLGKTNRSVDDFYRLYQAVLTQYEVSTIPAGLDQVHVSDIPDMRYRQTKHLIVLGAADGCFPAYKTEEGLLTESERKQLLSQGLCIAPGRDDRLDQELSRIYFALASANESLHLLYSGDQPAWLFRRAVALCPGVLHASDKQPALSMWELAAKCLREKNQPSGGPEELRLAQEFLSHHSAYSFETLSQNTVCKLYGNPITLSPSKIDKYANCKFAFFMNYGLRAKPRKQAKLDQPAFGTFVHAVLENTVLQVNKAGGFGTITEQALLEIVTQQIAAYADELFPEQEKRQEYLFERTKVEIREIVLDLWEELRRSKFQPKFCELKFADNGDLPAVRISGEKAECKVVGVVDRVDLYRDGDKDYVRVVDYKTGTKEFDYTEILYGAGLQMLIYLFALRSMGKQLTGVEKLEPAGVLYLPAKKAYPLTEAMPDEDRVCEKHQELKRRKGLIRGEELLLAAMEEDPFAPIFMPYKNGRKGLSGDLASWEQMELLERHVHKMIGKTGDGILSGTVLPDPVVRGQFGACRYCDYKTVCHKDLGLQEERIFAETSSAKFWEILEQEEAKHG